MKQYKIAVIITEYIRPYFEEAFHRLALDCEASFYNYDPLQGMEKTYHQVPASIDGILTIGRRFTTALVSLEGKGRRPVVPVNYDDAALYRLLWHLHLEKGVADFSRIYCDFLDQIHMSVEDFLTTDSGMTLSDSMGRAGDGGSPETFQYTEDLHYQKLLSIWRTQKFDAVITRYSGLIPLLRREGMCVYYPHPSLSTIADACAGLFREIEIRALQENQPAEIHFNFSPALAQQEAPLNPDWVDAQCLLLQNALTQFFSDSALGVEFRRSHFGVRVLTDRRAVAWCTNNYKNCMIQDYLFQHLGIHIHIGYGIGATLYDAKLNAVHAARESEILGGSYLINEKQELIGPLGQDAMLVVPTTPKELAGDFTQCGLSSLTVMKVLTAIKRMPDGQITARELAVKLSVTHRSANHFLSALEKVGMVKVVSTRRMTTRGRPERVYGPVQQRLQAGRSM